MSYVIPKGAAVYRPSSGLDQKPVLWDDSTKRLADASGLLVVTAGLANGSDDTTALQALLTAARTAGGGLVRGKPGQSYKLTSALVIGSGTTLDMTGCSVTEVNGSNDQMVANYSYKNPAASATDGAVSSGSNVVSTALGAGATVGQMLSIADAGGNGNGPLVGRVSARTSTTITLTTLDGRPCNATATVSSKAVKLYTPDTNIKIVGGTWNLGTNAPSPYPVILGYFVDGFTVDIDKFTANGTSRGVGVAAATNVWVRVRHVASSSVGVQFTGPICGAHIDYVEGQSTGDDLVALAAADYIGPGATGGDIVGVTVGHIQAADTYGNVFKVLAGAGRFVDAIKVGAVTGTSRSTVCYCGDDPSSASTVGGTYGDIDFGLIDVISTGGGQLFLPNPNADRIKATVRHDPLASVGGVAVGVGGSVGDTNPGTINILELSGEALNSSAGFVNIVNSHVTINQLILNAVRFAPSGSGFAALTTNTTPTVKDVVFRDCRFVSSGNTQYVVKWQTAGTLSRVRFVGGYYTGGVNMVDTQSSSTALTVWFQGCEITGFSRLAGFYSNTVVWLIGPSIDSITSAMLYISGGTLSVFGSGFSGSPGVALVQRGASETVRVNSPTLQVNQSLLTPNDGDMIYNSNASPANGIGVAVFNTAAGKWKNIYSGVTS